MYAVTLNVRGFEVVMHVAAWSKGQAIAIAEREYDNAVFVGIESV